MKKISLWFHNLKYRKKIEIVCLAISLIPMILLGGFSYSQIRTSLIAREKEILEDTLTQAVNTLDYKLASNVNALNYIVWNDELNTAVSTVYDNNFDMYIAYRDVIDNLFQTVELLNQEINNISIYSNGTLFPHGNILLPLSDIEDSPWFSTITRATIPYFIASPENKSLKLIVKLHNSTNEYINFIDMSVNYTDTFAPLSKLFENSYGFFIMETGTNHVLYSFINSAMKDPSLIIDSDEFLASLKGNTLSKDYVYYSTELSSTHWTAYIYRPVKVVSASANKITVIVSVIILFCIIFLFYLSAKLSKIMVQPIEKLVQNMESIEDGTLAITVTSNRNDEIGSLIQSFINMVHKLQYLIEEVYKSKISQQEYEMKALQAQINPHFLYNSLSLINGKAIMSQQDDISKMVQLLSTFYRTTLNKGKNTISVKDEWDNTVSYIKIQQMMHSYSFDVQLHIDESLFQYTMINLLLQPLVENAITHGLDSKTTKSPSILIVTAELDIDNLVFKVQDNGCGITPETLHTILTVESNGYGLKNVHDRVQLKYGSSYGLSFSSTPNEGTTSTLTIPSRVI